MMCSKFWFIFSESFLVFFIKTIRFLSVELVVPKIWFSPSRRSVPLFVGFYDLESNTIIGYLSDY